MSRLDTIEKLLHQKFNPTHLLVTNFSHEHSVEPGSESHIKVVIATETFLGLNRVQRHRMVYSCLDAEIQNGLHALQLHLFTEVELATATVEAPPKCKGGSA